MSVPALFAPAGAGGAVSVVAVAGSRQLPHAGVALVQQVAAALVAGGQSLAVGCCVGADAAVLSAVAAGQLPASRAQVFAAFGPVSPPFQAARHTAPGAFALSAVGPVAGALLAGASVSWWAGGGPGVPLGARLSARTRAVVGAAGGLVAFPAGPGSCGTALAIECAVSRGLPVVAFPVGFPGRLLPLPGSGVWVPLGGSAPWSLGFRWSPSQGALF